VEVWIAALIFLGTYALIASDRIHKTVAALAGGVLMIALRVIDQEEAFAAIDFNVIFLLLGMMVIANIMRKTGVFQWMAIRAIQVARGDPWRILVILCAITAVASAFLDNVTTVVLIGPITLYIAAAMRVSPVPYLIAEILASNIGGTATLIGDPPNIIIASRSGLTFNDFLVHLAPVVIVLVAVLIGVCRWLFAAAFRADHDRIAEIMGLDERELIKDHRLLVQSLVVLGVVLVAFVFHPVLGYEPAVVALLGAGLLVAVTRVTTEQALQDVEWGTLAFFMGLFVMVGSLVESGVLGAIAEGVAGFAGENLLGFTTVLVWGSGVLSGVVDNIPYVASMSPVVAGLVGPDGEPEVLWWALALGADLGGNATLIGASANVVVAGIAARNGYPIGFWQFTRYGLVVTFATIAVSYGYVVLRYFALA
jgi:Na+/H+ antiporter NhaD/arsenite permease-like protein